MFYVTIALLGLFLANNLNKTPRLYTLETQPAMISTELGMKHAHYELHRRMHRDLQLRDPRFYTKSETYKNIVDEANGPKENRTLFNLKKSKQGNLGDFTPVLADSTARRM
jgi:hypothetical protein